MPSTMFSLEPFSIFGFEDEARIRLVLFSGIFVLFALFEAWFPRRPRTLSRPVRWYSNVGMSFINSLTVRYVFPILGVGLAVLCRDRGWGLFNNIAAPYLLAFVLSALVLDFVVYLTHIMFHAVPWLWPLHRVHHADVDFDVSTGIRFHILESVISMMIKLTAVFLLGAPVMAVFFFEVLLNGAAMFNHANLRIPVGVDRVLRWFLVTPDMHRVHHSINSKEYNTNFGFNVPWWDRLFHTYTAQPAEGHQGMTIGLDRFRSEKDQHLHRLLAQPFIKTKSDRNAGSAAAS